MAESTADFKKGREVGQTSLHEVIKSRAFSLTRGSRGSQRFKAQEGLGHALVGLKMERATQKGPESSL